MSYTRTERVSSTLKKVIAQFLREEGGSFPLITVTKISISKDLKYSTVYLSVFPDDKEKEILMSLEKKKKDLRNFVKLNMRLKVLPLFELKIDGGEKHRQKIDAMDTL